MCTYTYVYIYICKYTYVRIQSYAFSLDMHVLEIQQECAHDDHYCSSLLCRGGGSGDVFKVSLALETGGSVAIMRQATAEWIDVYAR